METFYTPPRLIAPPLLTIEGDELKHLASVMRLRVGDSLRVVDGEGNSYGATIASITRNAALCTITGHDVRTHEAAHRLILGVGLLKNPARFDFLVEKSVELGTYAIVPLITERTVARHPRQEKKNDRWSRIALAAMKQSGRSCLPAILPPATFEEFIADAPPDSFRYLPHEKAPLTSPLTPPAGEGTIVLAIGPEGGFSDGETLRAEGKGFQVVSLGTRRLRTETAAIVAVAAVLRGA
jgi:16S rRNA (uracil1498-N3)-methyltransferase